MSSNPITEALNQEFEKSTIKQPKKETKPKKAKTSKKAEEITTEKRDKRVQIVMTQSLYDQLIETRFKQKERSLNQLVIKALTEYIERSK